MPSTRSAQGTRGLLLSRVLRFSWLCCELQRVDFLTACRPAGVLTEASQLHLTDAQLWSLYLDIVKEVGRGKNLGWVKGKSPLMTQGK